MIATSRLFLLAAILGFGIVAGSSLQAASFVRGDSDANGALEVTDAIGTFGYLFLGSAPAVDCLDAMDADDSGTVELTDGIYLLNFLFLGGPVLPAPHGSCGTDPSPDDIGCVVFPSCDEGLVRSDLERDEDPVLEPGDLETLVNGNTAFAFDLYSEVRKGDGNLFFSPLSVSVALAMTHAGARGETAAEMADVLHFDLAGDALHPAMNYLDLELADRGEGAAGHEGGGFQLRLVNAIWGQQGYGFLEDYLDVLARNYDAGMRLVDFMSDFEGARQTINGWVSDQTEEKIPELLASGSVDATTRLVLTNAMYFSAAWAWPFPEDRTTDRAFHRLGGSEVLVPMMSLRADFPHTSGEGYQAVELPYDGEELSMVIIVPDAGRFEEVEAKLDPVLLEGILGNLAPGDLDLTLPRFSCESSLGLGDTLTSLGMRQAFQPGVADLSGIDGTRNLYVQRVIHKAFVDVDEFGTEAAAATAVIVGIVSVPPELRVDRPFVFLIRDIPTETILFLGRVLDPQA